MGVTGLWRLIEPAGKPVPVETLENKVLAVDISIWLHQVVKGYQDAKGAPLPNAHLMGLFQRLCKLLYFRIKPIFVFDGAFPALKKETIAKRNDSKAKYNSESERLRREILSLLGKRTAIGALIGKQVSPTKSHKQNSSQANANDDIFKLPALPDREEESESESEDDESSSHSTVDLHSVDVEAENFKQMPLKEKYDLLIELKETRKMNSWGRIHELPKKSDNFSDFQMNRLLKRRKVQEVLEETEKEMGGNSLSLNELETLLNEDGINTEIESLPTKRIASNDNTRFLLIKDMKQTIEDARKQMRDKELKATHVQSYPSTSKTEQNVDTVKEPNKKDELEDDLQKAIQMSLECIDEPSISNSSRTEDSLNSSYMLDSEYSESDEESLDKPEMAAARAYIMQYSDYTSKAVNSVLSKIDQKKFKRKSSAVDEILEELNKENAIVTDNIDISSDEDVSNKQNETGSSEVEETLESSTIVLDSSEEVRSSSPKADVNTSQSSIIHIARTEHDAIVIDSSFEVVANTDQTENIDLQSDNSDEEFEDVPEIETKPIVEITLVMGQKPNDDIFSDIFTNKLEDSSKDVPKEIENLVEEDLNCHKIITNNDKEPESTDLETGSNKTLHNIEINEKSPNRSSKTISNCEEIHDEKKTVDVKNDKTPNSEAIQDDRKTSDVTNYKTPNSEAIQDDRKTNDVINDRTPNSEAIQGDRKTSDVTNDRIQNYEAIQDDRKTSDVTNDKINDVILKEKLEDLAEAIQIEEDGLVQEKSRLDRMSRNITEQMTKEVQELLQIFGIPYIVAPMEAEAQCAFLEMAKLTDGTITDDSDIWLFGGKTVYKNFFNQQKHVLQFLSDRIERSFNLNREQLILLALLVGSDYTTGVTGVGPVTAMEILASFPFSKRDLQANTSEQARYACLTSGLLEFKRWVKAGKRTDNTSLKRKLKNVSVADDFPSARVIQAYLEPNVEKNKDSFTWGEPDITILSDYTKTKFGWSQNKLDEILKPVLKRMLDRKTQRTVYDYFKRKVEFQSLEEHMSKRVRAAVQKMGPKTETVPETNETELLKGKKRKLPKNKKSNSTEDTETAGTSSSKIKKNRSSVAKTGVQVIIKRAEVNQAVETSNIEITIPKLNRCQEIIPQREKYIKDLMQNKMKAIEIYRKTKLDRQVKGKRKVVLPKEKAELSESSDSN